MSKTQQKQVMSNKSTNESNKDDKGVAKGVVVVDKGRTDEKKRGVGLSDHKKKQYKEMSVKQKSLVNQTVNALLDTGVNKLAAARLIGISSTALYKRLENHPYILERIDQVNKQSIKLARQKIDQFSVSGADNVISLATKANSENVRLNANLELLDRAGITRPQQQQTSVQVNVLNAMKKQSQEYEL